MEVKAFRRSAREAVRGKWKLALPLFLLAALFLQKFGVAQLRAALAPHVTLDPPLDVQEISLMPTWVSAVLLALELALGVAAGWIRIGMYGVSIELLEGRTPTLRTLFPGKRLGAGLLMGVLLTAFLPGVYLSLLSYHNEVLPLALMTSIYETQSRVPIPVFFELLLMSFAFDLINTAGARIPGAFGQALGVVSALIIGQAAVTADLVSPMLIIVVAVSGLGQLMITDYNLSLSFRMLQLLFSLSAALGGLYGMSLALLFFFGELCSLSSMGVPFFYPFAPTRMHNPDLLTR